jgi:hypothetical protein
MSKIIHVGSYTNGTTSPAQVTDMRISRGSGDLLITAAGSPGGSGYYNNINFAQSPTISGPWTPLPPADGLTLQTPDGTQTGAAMALVPFTWSQRYLQFFSNPSSGSVVNGFVILPGENELQ